MKVKRWNKIIIALIVLIMGFPGLTLGQEEQTTWGKDTVKIENGLIEGFISPQTGTRNFWGIPYAAAPVGDLRWKPPTKHNNWKGVRKANEFGPRAVQNINLFDMRFRTDKMGEDMLYLNVWAPRDSDRSSNLPVFVYFYGGGFVGGDGSEWRYDGAALAQKGIVVVTINYRLGIFGFFAHPELTKESPHKASGNYGLLDQSFALHWVKDNIEAFGGNPNQITIGGESAGSFSVSAQMASPLSRDLIAGAIGESGSILGSTLSYVRLEEAEKNGDDFAKAIGAKSLSDLRAVSAEELLSTPNSEGVGRWSIAVDGYFFPEEPLKIFETGKQSQVPLLVGWNSTEMPYAFLFGSTSQPTPENYGIAVEKMYPEDYKQVLALYPGNSQEEVIKSATLLGSDRFITYSTWKWSELHRTRSADAAVYNYIFNRVGPRTDTLVKQIVGSGLPAPIKGALHSWEIEYALGNLGTNNLYDWTAEDYKVSATMMTYFVNFIKTGNPNKESEGLPLWVGNKKGSDEVKVMHIDVDSELRNEDPNRRAQLEFLDTLN